LVPVPSAHPPASRATNSSPPPATAIHQSRSSHPPPRGSPRRNRPWPSDLLRRLELPSLRQRDPTQPKSPAVRGEDHAHDGPPAPRRPCTRCTSRELFPIPFDIFRARSAFSKWLSIVPKWITSELGKTDPPAPSDRPPSVSSQAVPTPRQNPTPSHITMASTSPSSILIHAQPTATRPDNEHSSQLAAISYHYRCIHAFHDLSPYSAKPISSHKS
jgi:hypothetical protein